MQAVASPAHKSEKMGGAEAERLNRAAHGLVSAIDHDLTVILWNKASEVTKLSIGCGDFVAAVEKIRGSLGELIGREWRSIHGLRVMKEGSVPPGRYASIEFISRFQGGGSVREAISLRHDEDGVWRFMGYSANKDETNPHRAVDETK